MKRNAFGKLILIGLVIVLQSACSHNIENTDKNADVIEATEQEPNITDSITSISWTDFENTSEDGNRFVIELSEDDGKYLSDFLSSLSWEDDLSECAEDYSFSSNNHSYLYHRDCGTVNDYENGFSASLTDEQRVELNSFLDEKFGPGIQSRYESETDDSAIPELEVIETDN